ncbi:MAG TPA: enoyl-CoA hydratase-related protein [Kofleriaceae bacterium]|jgi:enoyl-CoA hydratase/carnithine racemase
MTDHIRVTHAAGVATITMNRPAKKNALTDEMYAAMADALAAAEADPATRVVVLAGEGDLFTAGNDVTEFAGVAMGGKPPQHVGRFLLALSTATKPLVAAVQGKAIGIGTTMLLHCDLVILAEDATLATPFVSLALVPEAASSLLLPARVGHARAFAMFALGDPIAAADAVAWGIANRAVPRAELAATAAALADRLARQPLGALVATKRLMRPPAAVAAQLELETREFLARLTTAEAREAFTAFAQRRAPDFSKLSP